MFGSSVTEMCSCLTTNISHRIVKISCTTTKIICKTRLKRSVVTNYDTKTHPQSQSWGFMSRSKADFKLVDAVITVLTYRVSHMSLTLALATKLSGHLVGRLMT